MKGRLPKEKVQKKRGPKPAGKVTIQWSPEFAYAIGLIVTDGNLSPDGRHINFTTKDKELAITFKRCLKIDNKTGRKARGRSGEKKYFCVQFGDVAFYNFLLSIGLMPRKSKVINRIKVPNKFFFDFLRGHLDGDGTFYSYFDPRWRSSFMFYLEFISASKKHIGWLRKTLLELIGVDGHVTNGGARSICYQLKYAKAESIKIINKIYSERNMPCLMRKRLKIEKALGIIGLTIPARVSKPVNELA